MDNLFRWDLTRREQLGRLLDRQKIKKWPDDEYPLELRDCAAGILAASKGGDLWFVGRSLESVFDYLSGAFHGAAGGEKAPSLGLINVSVKTRSIDRHALTEVLSACGFSPSTVLEARRPQVIADIVSSGRTMEVLVTSLVDWCRRESHDLQAVLKKLHLVGVLQRKKNSPNTWRWHQHAEWLRDLPGVSVENVSVTRDLYGYFADYQPKVGFWNPPSRWDADPEDYVHSDYRLFALARAVTTFDHGADKAERRELIRLLSGTHAMREPWMRGLLSALR